MAYTRYYYMLSLAPGTRARVWVNGIPLRQHWEESGTNRCDAAIHLLQPGDNTLVVEIYESEEWLRSFFEINDDYDHDHPVIYFAWPDECKSLPAPERQPYRFETAFCPLGETFSSVHLSALPQDFDETGTPALRHAVEQLHAAVEQRDVELFMAQRSLLMEETERAYPGWAGTDRGELRKETEEFFAQNIQVRPLEMDKVVFERCCDGRVACARHLEGGNVIEALSVDDPTSRLVLEPVLTMHEGQWKLFR